MADEIEERAPHRCTVGHVRAHVVAMGLLAISVAAMLAGHAALWDRPAGTLLESLFESDALFVAIVIGLFVHELLHVLGFRYVGGAPWRTIRLGIQWRTITPFARAIVPVSAQAYRWTAALPGLSLGALPIIAGVVTDLPLASGFGVLMLAGAGGDAAIIWAMRHTPDDALVLDCPDALGCLVTPSPRQPA